MKYRPEIDGLRALAVVPVILFHAGLDSFGGGFVGVDIFFVISGYLITSIIIKDLDKGNFSLVSFYERRARRLLPALFFVFLACLPFAYFWLLPNEFKLFSYSLISTSVFLSNIFFWLSSGYFAPQAELNPLLHTWSLAVEEQYYLFFPPLLMMTWCIGRQKILYILFLTFIISLITSHIGAYSSPNATFFLLHTRLWELMLGAIVALYLFDHPKAQLANDSNGYLKFFFQIAGLSGLALILFSIFKFNESTPFPSLYALIPTIGTALIIMYSLPGTLSQKILSFKPFVFLGLLSYSAYLWHQPIFAFAKHRSLYEVNHETMIILSAASIIIAFLSWRFIERPFRDSNFLTQFTVFRLSIFGLIFFLVIGVIGTINNGLSQRMSDSVLLISNQNKNWRDTNPCTFEGPISLVNLESCYNPDNTVYLIGDSHAQSLAKPLRSILEANGYNLISWTSSACMPIAGVSRLPESKKCSLYIDQMKTQIASNPGIIVMSSRWRLNLKGNRFDNREGGVEIGPSGQVYVNNKHEDDVIAYILRALKVWAHDYPMILVDQIPEAGWNVPTFKMKQIMFQKGPFRPVTTSYNLYKRENSEIIKIFSELNEVATVIETAPLVCDQISGRCNNEVGGISLYRDNNHPSKVFSEIITEKIWEKIKTDLSKERNKKE